MLQLNFAQLTRQCANVAQFERKLSSALRTFAAEHAVELKKDYYDVTDMFSDLLGRMPPRSAVLLIDEHDAPLIDHLDNEVQRTAAAAILAGLYQVIKDLPDKLRCVFVTGIMRYKDLGLGSAGNSFTDISDLPRFGACCGYTRAELKQYFSLYLRYAASVRLHKAEKDVTAADLEQLLDDLSEWYGGFCFDDKHLTRVFSSWSMLRFFED